MSSLSLSRASPPPTSSLSFSTEYYPKYCFLMAFLPTVITYSRFISNEESWASLLKKKDVAWHHEPAQQMEATAVSPSQPCVSHPLSPANKGIADQDMFAPVVASMSPAPTITDHASTFGNTIAQANSSGRSSSVTCATATHSPPTTTTARSVYSIYPYPRGMLNLGDTCFVSVVVQVLARCRPFVALLRTMNMSAEVRPSSPFLCAVYDLLREMASDRAVPVDPSPLVSVLRESFLPLSELEKQSILTTGVGGGYSQHDAEELFSFLLWKLSDEYRLGTSSRIMFLVS